MKYRRLDEYLRQAAKEIRHGDVDVEVLLRRLAEAIVDEVLSRGAGRHRHREDDTTVSVLAERIARLEEQVKHLTQMVAELHEAIRALTPARDTSHTRSMGEPEEDERDSTGQEPEDTIADIVRKKCYIFLSEERLNPRDIDHSKLLDKGIIVIELSRDIVLADKLCLARFIDQLSAIETSDDREAAQLLGQYSSLFRALRSDGLIIYSSNQRRWVVQAELRRVLG